MAKRKATLQVNANVNGAVSNMRSLSKEMRSVGQGVTKLDAKMRRQGEAASQSTAANVAAGKAFKLATGAAVIAGVSKVIQVTREWAAESRQIQGVFNNLPFSIEGARNATQGYVDNLTLATAAAKANSLGAATSAQEFEKLSLVAAKAAKSLGTDAGQATTDLSLALGRMSPQVLDNLGVTLKLSDAFAIYGKRIGKSASALTDAEKKTAFATVAMERLESKFSDVDLEAGGFAGTVRKLEVGLENLGILAKGADESQAGLNSALADMGEKIHTLRLDKYGADVKEVEKALREYGLTIEDVGGAQAVANQIRARSVMLLKQEKAAVEDAKKAAFTGERNAEAAALREQIAEQEHKIELAEAYGLTAKQISGEQEYLNQLLLDEIDARAQIGKAGENERANMKRKIELEQARASVKPRSRGRGRKRKTNDDFVNELINSDDFTDDPFERERAKLDAQVAAFVEFDQMMADSAADLALAREESAARALKAQEELLEAQKKAAKEEAKIALKRRETQTAIALTVVDATQSQLETLAAAAITGEQISGKEIKTAARTQSAVLGVQAAMHFARAAAYGLAGSPLAITQALAGAKATAGAASILAIGEGFGALVGGGGGGGSGGLGAGGAFAGGGGARESKDLNDAPVSPLQGDGTIPAQTSGDTGTAVNVTVQGSVLSEGDLTRKIRDAIRNGAAA